MTADLGGDPSIGFESVYDCVSLSLMDKLFIGGVVTSNPNPPSLNDVDFGVPDFCSDDLFFRNEFRGKLDADSFYDAVDTIHKTGTLTTNTTISTPVDEPPPSDHP